VSFTVQTVLDSDFKRENFINFYSFTINVKERKVWPVAPVRVRISLMLQYFLHQTHEVAANQGKKQTVASNGEITTEFIIKSPHILFFPFPAQRPKRETMWEGKELKPPRCTS